MPGFNEFQRLKNIALCSPFAKVFCFPFYNPRLLPNATTAFCLSRSTIRCFVLMSSSSVDGSPKKPPKDDKDSMYFGDLPFRNRPFGALLFTSTILGICQCPSFVRNSSWLLGISQKLVGRQLTEKIVRSTFFKQFCGGEELSEVSRVINILESQGVGTVLDFAVESDIHESHGALNQEEIENNFNKNMDNIKAAIVTSSSQKNGFTAVKMTSLMSSDILLKASFLITQLQALYAAMIGRPELVQPGCVFAHTLQEHTIDRELFLTAATSVFLPCADLNSSYNELVQPINSPSCPPSEAITFNLWMMYFSLEKVENLKKLSFFSDSKLSWSEHDIQVWKEGLKRLMVLSEVASGYKNLSLLIDAEQSYFQPAIDDAVLKAQQAFNSSRAVVYNTYQAYRRDAESRVLADLNTASLMGYKAGLKLVRGAYLSLERQQAVEMAGLDPINPTLKETHQLYDSLVKILITKSDAELLLGTHNEESIKLAVSIIDELNAHSSSLGTNRSSTVSFGQLYGMCDHVTFSLESKGYRALKYVPYGPVNKVLPYLIRRAEENASLLNSSRRERALIHQEILRRLKKPYEYLRSFLMIMQSK